MSAASRLYGHANVVRGGGLTGKGFGLAAMTALLLISCFLLWTLRGWYEKMCQSCCEIEFQKTRPT